MFGILTAVGVVLVLLILIVMFRLDVLLGVARKKDDTTIGTSNNVNAVLMVLFMLGGLGWFLWFTFAEVDRYTLPLASEHGAETDYMFNVTMWITGVVFIVTNILLFYFSFHYRHKKGTRAIFYSHNNKLEFIWTIIPAIVLTYLVASGLIVWGDIMEEAPEDAEVIEVMGYQFAWEVRYPGKDNKLGDFHYQKIDGINQFGLDLADTDTYDDFSTLQIHIPVDKTVLFKIRARDVLHSVFLPHFRVKMDAVPGMYTQFKFTANKTTAEMREELGDPEFNYELACTEVCGRGHFGMRKVLVVMEQDEYEQWKAEQKPWLKLNPDQLTKVPENQREAAMVKAGITREEVQDLEASL